MPSAPRVYELNTRCWLRELSARAGTLLTLGTVPEAEILEWKRLGFTHLWLMGAWQTSPQSLAFSRQPARRREWRKQLPDLRDEDIGGSPYAIGGYALASALGDENDLAQFRRRLGAQGLKLILDFIPNHVGLGHSWVAEHPERFVHSRERRAGAYRVQTRFGLRWIAQGKDPYFPPWADTKQLDYRHAETQAAMRDELISVARRCDGVRCDMAMLVLRDVFAQNWSNFPAATPQTDREFWAEAIPAVKTRFPDFLFLAEAYWDLEARLLELGFDFTYDKRVTDYLVARQPAELRRHLGAKSAEFVRRTTHFLENHDEPRAAGRFSVAEHRAAALLVLALPGMALLHEGQLTGATRHASVHLTRRPVEPPQPEVASFYQELLTMLAQTSVGRGRSELLKPRPARAENSTAENIVAVLWQALPPGFDLVLVNLASTASQGVLDLPGMPRHPWEMSEFLSGERREFEAGALQGGLCLDLPPHAAQMWRCAPKGPGA